MLSDNLKAHYLEKLIILISAPRRIPTRTINRLQCKVMAITLEICAQIQLAVRIKTCFTPWNHLINSFGSTPEFTLEATKQPSRTRVSCNYDRIRMRYLSLWLFRYSWIYFKSSLIQNHQQKTAALQVKHFLLKYSWRSTTKS